MKTAGHHALLRNGSLITCQKMFSCNSQKLKIDDNEFYLYIKKTEFFIINIKDKWK